MRTWLYLPTGNKVEFEFSDSSIPEDDYANALGYTNRLLALGASVTAPGLEAGEQKEQVGYVVYRSKVNDDGTETPILDLYLTHDATKFKFLTVYLNTPEDVTSFEQVSGLKLLADMPYWEGGHLERGNPKTDRYFVAPRKMLTVVHKLNERYNPDEPDMTKRKPKRLFVRWESVGTPTVKLPAPSVVQNTGANDLTAISTPQTPENAGKGNVVANTYRVSNFQVNLTGGRVPQPYLIFSIAEIDDYAYSFTRQPFKEAGYDIEGWKSVGNHEMPCPAEITIEKKVNKDGAIADKWTVKEAKMIDLFADSIAS